MRRENRPQKSCKENKALSLKRFMKRKSIAYPLGEVFFRFSEVSHPQRVWLIKGIPSLYKFVIQVVLRSSS